MGSKITLELIITTHAYKRAKERMGLSKQAFDTMALKAFVTGKEAADCKGLLRKWLTDKMNTHGSSNIRIYGNYAYVFAEYVLVTVLHIPNDLKQMIGK
jgi:hypothetical protein